MKLNLSARFLMLALLCGSCVLNTPKEELEYNGMNTLQISNVDDLISFYQYADDRIPLISGHRGGRGKGYPENSMETFENTLSYTPATFEIDPRLTKDSVIVLSTMIHWSVPVMGLGKFLIILGKNCKISV